MNDNNKKMLNRNHTGKVARQLKLKIERTLEYRNIVSIQYLKSRFYLLALDVFEIIYWIYHQLRKKKESKIILGKGR